MRSVFNSASGEKPRFGLGRSLGVLRRLAAPVGAGDISLSSSATLNAQFWLGQFPWRVTAAWSMAAAILAAGFGVQTLSLDWRSVVLLFLLADPLWGAIWRLAAGRSELLPLHGRVVAQHFWLPYLQPNSPAARLLETDEAGTAPLILRVVVPTILLTFLVASALSLYAVWLTGIVILLSVFGRISLRTLPGTPTLLHSIVAVGLPWSLTLHELGISPDHPRWAIYLALLGLWVVHNWGEGRMGRISGDVLGIGLLAVADLGIGVLLVAARAPLWLALVAVAWLPTWLAIYFGHPLRRLNIWWLLAMLISSLGVGQGL